MPLTIGDVHVPLRLTSDGAIRVGETRITLGVLLGSFLAGNSPETIVSDFDTLDIEAVYAVIAFYYQNKPQVDQYLQEVTIEAEALRQKIEAQQEKITREALLNRLKVSQALNF